MYVKAFGFVLYVTRRVDLTGRFIEFYKAADRWYIFEAGSTRSEIETPEPKQARLLRRLAVGYAALLTLFTSNTAWAEAVRLAVEWLPSCMGVLAC